MELPIDPEMVLPALVGGDRSDVGSRFARFVLDVLEDPERRARAVAIVRAAASEPTAAEAVRELVSRRVVGAIAAALAADDADLRASLGGSQIVGLVMARYIVGIEPLASLPPAAVADAIAPTLQRYLTEPLDREAPRRPPAAAASSARSGGAATPGRPRSG